MILYRELLLHTTEVLMPRRPVWFALSAFALLALAACAQQQAATPAPAPLTSDQQFIDRAALGTASEVQLGQLARTRAASPAVRAFGNRIIADHRQAHAQLNALERRIGLLPASSPLPRSQLAALFGADFDRQFMADQVKNHQEAIALFQAEAQNGRDPRIRRYASDTLPMLYRNLQQAQAIAARLGG
jgi:putative membrane protein